MSQRIGGVRYDCRHCLGPAVEVCDCPCHRPRTDGWEGRAACDDRESPLVTAVRKHLLKEKQTMTVRAKFKVQSITESDGGLKTARLLPVTSGSPENETPGGSIDLGTMNPAAAAEFRPGRECYVDFIFPDEA